MPPLSIINTCFLRNMHIRNNSFLCSKQIEPLFNHQNKSHQVLSTISTRKHLKVLSVIFYSFLVEQHTLTTSIASITSVHLKVLRKLIVHKDLQVTTGIIYFSLCRSNEIYFPTDFIRFLPGLLNELLYKSLVLLADKK